MRIDIRQAVDSDIPTLRILIEASVRQLQAGDYTPEQIERALATVYGADTQLIADGTYYVAEILVVEAIPSGRRGAGSDRGGKAVSGSPLIAGCGGWSKRRTLFGGDQYARREDSLLDPRVDAAKIRAFFVHPDWARRGIGGLILEACERAALSAGFTRLEMGATLTGIPFYRAKGYAPLETIHVPLGDGTTMPVVRMSKQI